MSASEDDMNDELSQRAALAKPTVDDDSNDDLVKRSKGITIKPAASSKPAADVSWWDEHMTPILRDNTLNPVAGGAEALMSGVTGLASYTAGNLAGLALTAKDALTGNLDSDAEGLKRDIQERNTYQPRTIAGAAINKVLGLPGRALGAVAEPVADLYGKGARALGVPEPAISGLQGGIKELYQQAPAFIGGRKIAEAPKPEPPIVPPQAALDTTYASGSMGAAKTAPRIGDASPPLQAEIKDAINSGDTLDHEAMTRQMRADKFGVQLTKGQATQDEAQLFNEEHSNHTDFSTRRSDTNKALIKGITDEQTKVTGGQAGGADPVTAGQSLIDEYKTVDAPLKADARAKWKAFQDAAGGALPIEPGDFTTNVAANLKATGKTRYLPSDVAGDIADIDNGEPFTVERWDNLKTNLAAAQRTAERSGNTNAGLAISAARDAVENYQFKGLDPKLAELNSQARAATKLRYDKMKADPAYDVAVNDRKPVGQLSTEADDFIDKHVINGDRASLVEMQKNLASSPSAKATIANAAFNRLKTKAGIDPYSDKGNFSNTGFNRAVRDMPNLPYMIGRDSMERMTDLGNVADDAMFQPKGYKYNNSGTGIVAGIVQKVGKPVGRLLETGVNSFTGKLKVGSGAREAVTDYMEDNWRKESLKPGAGIRTKATPQTNPMGTPP
jgi:hypothetical protein